MTAIRLENFSGLAPKYSIRKLKNNWASTAINAQLYSGELRGLKVPLLLQGLALTTSRVFRLFGTQTYVQFSDKETSFLRAQVTNDSFDRYYWSNGVDAPRFAKKSALLANPSDPNNLTVSAKLGVPRPDVAPLLTVVGGSGVKETRAYVYTFVNSYGEESAPSDPSLVVTGFTNGSWNLSGMDTSVPVGYDAVDVMRIYRTVTGLTTIDYRFVAEKATPSAIYNDIILPDTVSLNEPISSEGWEVPPVGLDGIVNMPNGMMAGFVGRDVYVCDPYHPHTWPTENIITVDADIIGLGVHQSGLVVCTNSNPYIISGVSPLNLSAIKLDEVEPCQSRYSIASTQNGVYYASQNGLVLANESGASIITTKVMTRNEWRSDYSPSTINGAVLGISYIGFHSESAGFILGPESGEAPLVDLGSISLVVGVQTDTFSAEVLLIRNAELYQWNPPNTSPYTFSWVSKEFETPRPVNFGAIKIKWTTALNSAGTPFVPDVDYSIYNAYRLAAGVNSVATSQKVFGLNPLNYAPVNQVPHADQGGMGAITPTYTPATDQADWAINPVGFDPSTDVVPEPYPAENKTDFSGSAIRNSNPLNVINGVLIRIWGDGVLRYENQILDEKQHRLPSGYKADIWKVELQSADVIYSVLMAETGKELATA